MPLFFLSFGGCLSGSTPAVWGHHAALLQLSRVITSKQRWKSGLGHAGCWMWRAMRVSCLGVFGIFDNRKFEPWLLATSQASPGWLEPLLARIREDRRWGFLIHKRWQVCSWTQDVRQLWSLVRAFYCAFQVWSNILSMSAFTSAAGLRVQIATCKSFVGSFRHVVVPNILGPFLRSSISLFQEGASQLNTHNS